MHVVVCVPAPSTANTQDFRCNDTFDSQNSPAFGWGERLLATATAEGHRQHLFRHSVQQLVGQRRRRSARITPSPNARLAVGLASGLTGPLLLHANDSAVCGAIAVPLGAHPHQLVGMLVAQRPGQRLAAQVCEAGRRGAGCLRHQRRSSATAHMRAARGQAARTRRPWGGPLSQGQCLSIPRAAHHY
jgi:hypothetical protein